jgi:murein peptide amidase A
METRETTASVGVWLQSLEKLAVRRGFEVQVWGTSGELPLLGLLRAAEGRDAPRIYLSAGIHGDEPAGPWAIERLLRKDLLHRHVNWVICPLLNPHGRVCGTRETPDGIDMNRDYREPRSPEVAAHRKWIEHLPSNHLYLSLHEDWEASGFYLYELNNSSWATFGRSILHRVEKVIPIEPVTCIDDHHVSECGYILHPPEPDDPLLWPEAIYHLKRYRHLSYTFETPSSRDLEQRTEAHILATCAAVEEFLQLHSANLLG